MSQLRVWGLRGGLIGDCVAALPVYALIEKRYPGAHKYWQISRKCSQAAPLFYNNPLVNELVISDCNEGMGPRDKAIAATCQIQFNVMPPGHPDGDDWINRRDLYAETAMMAGLGEADYAELTPDKKRPKLAQWFTVDRQPKTIALWPGARQGEDRKRHPDFEWYEGLVVRLAKEGYKTIHFGHPNDFGGRVITGAEDGRHGVFFDQIRASIGCLPIGTDSGSSIALGGYGIAQITLVTNHWPGHRTNLTALAPNNPNNVTFVSRDNHNGHDLEKVLDTIKQLT